MHDYAVASRTKDYFALQLFSQFPQIVSVSPRLALDSNGVPTDEGVIAIGIRNVSTAHDLRGQQIDQALAEIPRELPIVEPNGTLSAEMMPVIVEDRGDILFAKNTARIRPCPGGFSISPQKVINLGNSGTLGAVVRVNGTFGFILSCNHTIAQNNFGPVGAVILQPAVIDGDVSSQNAIATLERWVPITFDGETLNEVDCALARVLEPWEDFVTRNVYEIGIPATIGNAKVNQAVRKSGRTTGLTNGTVLSENATILVSGALFQNQLEMTSMAAPGDSGSLLFDQNSLTALGLIFAADADGSRCNANKVDIVLDRISQRATVFNFDGTRTEFDEIKVELF
jgi:hypothetical protein